MDTLTHPPGLRIEFVDPQPPIRPTRIDIPVIVGAFERGPVDVPVQIATWPQFLDRFGGFVPWAFGTYAVKAFFEQGGDHCWVVRAAAPHRHTVRSGAPSPDRSTSLLDDLTGFVPGAAATVMQGDVAHTYLVTAVDTVASSVEWDRPLHPDIDTTISFDVDTGAGPARGAALDDGGAAVLDLEASTPGVWGNHVAVVVGPGRRAATTNRLGEPASLLAQPVELADGFAPGVTVTATQQVGGVMQQATLVADSVARDRRVISWRTPLPASFVLTQPISYETERFSLTVLFHGDAVEVHSDLDVDPQGPNAVTERLDRSAWIRGAVAGAGVPTHGAVILRNGRNGTAALTTFDLLGSDVTARGLAAAADVRAPALVLLPDLVAPSTPAIVLAPQAVDRDPCAPCPVPPSPPDALDAIVIDARHAFDTTEIALAQQHVVERCEQDTERVAILDLPCTDGPLDGTEMRDWAGRFSSSYALLAAPWLRVLDPDTGSSGALRRVASSGHLAGVIAATDIEVGPWRAAANRPVAWAHQLDRTVDDALHATLNAAGVTVLRAMPGRGVMTLGARTLSADTLWLFANVRRAMIMLRRTLRVALAWVAFEPADHALDATVGTAIGSLLESVWEEGGLAGATPDEAFFVTTGLGDRSVGRFEVEIGVALARPAEFVRIRVARSENRLELSEAPERGRLP